MKKTLCFIMVFVILSVFCACHVQEDSTESTGVLQNSGMPPRRMKLFSEEALTAVINSAKLSDAEFTEFVAQAWADKDDQISIPNDTEKHEVESLVQFLTSVGVPMLNSDVTLESFYFEYRPQNSWIGNFYIIDGVKYVFVTCPHKGNIVRSKGNAEGVWTIGEDSIPLHRNEIYLEGKLYKEDYVVAVDIVYMAGVKTENSIDMQTLAPIEFIWSNEIGEVE